MLDLLAPTHGHSSGRSIGTDPARILNYFSTGSSAWGTLAPLPRFGLIGVPGARSECPRCQLPAKQ